MKLHRSFHSSKRQQHKGKKAAKDTWDNRKTVDVNKYVNAEQMARIESFMKGFEADFDEVSATALNEFPDITQEAASNIALAYINQTY